MAIIDKIQLSGTVYTIGNETTTAVTSASTDNEIPTAKAVYDAIPQGGGGGKAIEAGRAISITTGETADTVSFNLPISAGTKTSALIYNSTTNSAKGYCSNAEGELTTASGYYSHAEGYIAKANGYASHAEGESTKSNGYSSHAEGTETEANGDYSHSEGHYTRTTNESEHSSGRYNNSVSASTTWGNSGNTLFSVGNGKSNSSRHNAIDIRQNGDIYIADTNDTSTTNYYEKPMIKLQDALGGGGGSSYTAGDGIDITNDVISVTGKVDTTAFTAHTADTVIHVTSDEKAAWNGKQDTLVSGTNIKTINGETLLGEGNIEIQGGGDVNVDQSLDSGSTNPVANSAITNALHETYFYNLSKQSDHKPETKFSLLWKYIDTKQTTSYNPFFVIAGINGTKIASLGGNPDRTNFELVETSAITTSISSSSTDSQVPSAKAVNDKLGGLSLVKLTQSEYDSLTTKDNSILYVIVN